MTVNATACLCLCWWMLSLTYSVAKLSAEQIASTLRTHLTRAARRRSRVLLFPTSPRNRRTRHVDGQKASQYAIYLMRSLWIVSLAADCRALLLAMRRRPLLCYPTINMTWSRHASPTCSWHCTSVLCPIMQQTIATAAKTIYCPDTRANSDLQFLFFKFF